MGAEREGERDRLLDIGSFERWCQRTFIVQDDRRASELRQAVLDAAGDPSVTLIRQFGEDYLYVINP